MIKKKKKHLALKAWYVSEAASRLGFLRVELCLQVPEWPSLTPQSPACLLLETTGHACPFMLVNIRVVSRILINRLVCGVTSH